MESSKKLIAIKLIHTLIWAFFAGVIIYIDYCAVTGRINTCTWIGIYLVLGETFVLLVFKMFCPLTLIARKYSDSTAANFDIYLPIWLARYNKIIFGTLFTAGLVVILFRILVL